ncbi:MAG: hypothetical protein QOE36_1917 [Gaiellaceae bacterium]|jgi:dienelactone hydrolase|nr:hypothetical protein [Gaiellaceae bacterium]
MALRRTLVPLLFLCALAAGCGGSERPAARAAVVHAPIAWDGPLGHGPDTYWLVHPRAHAKAIVIFLHGLGGPQEEMPVNHRRWVEHLAASGDAVIYPRYEVGGGDPGALLHVFPAVRAGMKKLHANKLPVVAVGYSRGGHLAVEYAATAYGRGPLPNAVVAVFPEIVGPTELRPSFADLDPRTSIQLWIGDKDTGPRGDGARELLKRLEAVGFPAGRVSLHVVHSHGKFVADHLSVLDSTPAAQAAFWAPLDRIVARYATS